MKNLLIVIVVLFSIEVFADGNIDIDSYISKINEASSQKRVKLMNEFKQKVAQMNREERLKTIEKMQIKMKTPSRKNHSHIQNQPTNEIQTYQMMNPKPTENLVVPDVMNIDGMIYKEHR